jgi:hypothetical protein
VRGHLLLTAAIAGVSQALVAAQQPEARFTARSELVVLHASVTDGEKAGGKVEAQKKKEQNPRISENLNRKNKI